MGQNQPTIDDNRKLTHQEIPMQIKEKAHTVMGVILGHKELLELRSYFIAPPTRGRINPEDNSKVHFVTFLQTPCCGCC